MRRFLLFLGLFLLAIFLVLESRVVWRWAYPLKYRDLIFAEAEGQGVDPFLVAAVIRVESNFRAGAVSPKGARGLMQLLPSTAQWIAGKANMRGFAEAQLDDPATNIKMGTWYLRYLSDEFEGNMAKTLAAYNAGRGYVKDWVTAGKWSGTLSEVGSIPFAETRDFVRLVYHSWGRYRWVYGPFDEWKPTK